MPEIRTRRDGAIATIVMSNPAKFNAMTPEMWDDLGAALDAAERDAEVRAIVLAGDGDRAFVSGADISRLGQPRPEPVVPDDTPPELRAPFMAPMRCTKPVIAKIRGICMGGGLGLAAACDLRFCSDDAVFRMPAARLGTGYGEAGVWRYMDIIGPANTLDIFLSARKFDAAEALRMGFVSRVVPAGELDRMVDDYCALMADNAPLTMAAAKRTVAEGLKAPDRRDLAGMQALIRQCLESEDFVEGRRAFMEKRKAQFRGR